MAGLLLSRQEAGELTRGLSQWGEKKLLLLKSHYVAERSRTVLHIILTSRQTASWREATEYIYIILSTQLYLTNTALVQMYDTHQ